MYNKKYTLALTLISSTILAQVRNSPQAVAAAAIGKKIVVPPKVEPTKEEIKADKTRALYQLMKDAHELLTNNNLTYWADGGTLLGAIRHGGIIPWDNDLDIDMDVTDKERFLKLRPQFTKLGYLVEPCKFGFTISKKVHNETVGLDIFLMEKKDIKYCYIQQEPEHIWAYRGAFDPIFYKQEELFPLKEYTFGEIKIYGANNPAPFLNYLYGDDWSTMKQVLTHFACFNRDRKKVLLTEQEKLPKQPTGPLEDRVQKR